VRTIETEKTILTGKCDGSIITTTCNGVD